jgi:hypothetical protein
MPFDLKILSTVTPLAITVAEVKTWLKIDNTAEDTVLARMLSAAAIDAGLECGRGFGVYQYSLVLDGFPYTDEPQPVAPRFAGPFWPGYLSIWPGLTTNLRPGSIPLPIAPVLSVDLLRYYDTTGTLTTLDPSEYWPALRTKRIASAKECWPLTQCGRPEAVEVQFTAGDAAVPDMAWQAIQIILSDRYFNRGDGDNDGKRKPIPDAARRLLMKLHDGRFV